MVVKVFINSGEKYVPEELVSFDDERKDLEKIIIKHPQLIPLDIITSINELGFFPISSQLETTHGPLDIIGIDTYGEIYIIETKLYSNSDRRCITAQVWDYAGGLSTFSDDFDDFKERITKANQSKKNIGTPLENMTLEQIVSEIPGSEEEDLLKRIKKNFQDSKFRFILVLDKVDEKLKADLTYHNRDNEKESIYALTLSQFKPEGASYDIMISDVFGTETAKKSQTVRDSNKWKEGGELEFLKLLNSNPELSDEEKKKVRELFYELKEILGIIPNSNTDGIGYYDWGAGTEPKFQVRLYEIGYHTKNDYSRLAFKIRSDGFMRFAITGHTKEIAKKFGERFTEELRKIPCAKELVRAMDDGRKEPSWSPKEWIPCKNDFLKIIKNSKPYSSSFDIT
jgi:hypothetical protein